MLTKPLSSLTEADLLELISNQVRESKTIEYKRELPGNADRDKKEFLGDVSSFANTLGGDLLYGVAEVDGLPVKLAGIETAKLDEGQRRLNSIIESGLDPRIRYSAQVVPVSCGDGVLVVRVERSWIGPHRVVIHGHDKFYGRNSAGKYALDVGELRQAFALSEAITRRIREFRVNRTMALQNNETPIPMAQDAKLIFHVLPLVSFAGAPKFDVIGSGRHPRILPTIDGSTFDHRTNLDGVVSYRDGKSSPQYTQLFRNGVIEAVHGKVTFASDDGRRCVNSGMYERGLVERLPHYFEELQRLECPGPIFLALALTGAKGTYMHSGRRIFVQHAIDRDTLLLPEIEVPDYSAAPEVILKPLFDMVWNACGYAGSWNYDEAGKWAPR